MTQTLPFSQKQQKYVLK